MLDSPTNPLSCLSLLSVPELKNQMRFKMRFEKPTSHITIRLQSAWATSVQLWVTLMETFVVSSPAKDNWNDGSFNSYCFFFFIVLKIVRDGRFLKLLGQILDVLRFYTLSTHFMIGNYRTIMSVSFSQTWDMTPV